MATLEEISGEIDRVILAVVDLQEGQHRIEERMITREQFDEALTNVVLLKRHLHLA